MTSQNSESNQTPEPAFWNHVLYKIPLVDNLRAHYTQIRDEILDFIEQKNPLKFYPQYPVRNEDTNNKWVPIYNQHWTVMPYSKFEDEMEAQERLYPHFAEYAQFVQENIPLTYSLVREGNESGWLRNGFVSRLIPGTIINPHKGMVDKYLRVHLCLKTDLGCAITVGKESQKWYDGQFLAFKDGGPYNHSVQHNGQHERIIMSMDLKYEYLQKLGIELG